jgi:hypothetical protein
MGLYIMPMVGKMTFVTASEEIAHPSTLAGLKLAKYVLMRLVDNQSLEKLAEELDDDVRFINGIVDFLNDIRWIKRDPISGLYQITKIGRMKVNASKRVTVIQ